MTSSLPSSPTAPTPRTRHPPRSSRTPRWTTSPPSFTIEFRGEEEGAHPDVLRELVSLVVWQDAKDRAGGTRDIINCYSYLSSLVAYCSNPPYPPPASFESYAPMDYFASQLEHL
jgi:hypothetical protein